MEPVFPGFGLGLGGARKVGEGVLRDEEGAEPDRSTLVELGSDVSVACVEDTVLKAGDRSAARDVSMTPEFSELNRVTLSALAGSGAAGNK